MNILQIILLLILAIVVLLLAVVLFIKARIVLKAVKPMGEAVQFSVYLELLGGRYKRNLSLSAPKKKSKKKVKKEQEESKEEAELTFGKKLLKWYEIFLKTKYTYLRSRWHIRKHFRFEMLKLHICFGIGDAAQTGITTGVLWACVYNVVGFFAKIAQIPKPDIQIQPQYDKSGTEFTFEGIICLRLVNVISILCHTGVHYLGVSRKIKKSKGKGGD